MPTSIPAPPGVLVFTSGDDVFTVIVDFDHGLEDRPNAELERLLDEARG